MKYAIQYIKTAATFIDDYDGSLPLHHYLKGRFTNEKKYGSRDRKLISHLCYCHFRLGHFLNNTGAEERIKIFLFLTHNEDWKDVIDDELLLMWDKTFEEKITYFEAKYQQSLTSIFTWQKEVSDDVDKILFSLSHLRQPHLFIRVRPGKETIVKEKLARANIPFNQITNNCIAFENATKLTDVLELNKEYVVQDRSSQQAGEFLLAINYEPSAKVWDCCAASGGKAIMACDFIPNIFLTVSDIRQSIIHNLQTRFKQAGITKYKAFIADLSKPDVHQRFNLSANQLYDLIICDAPCSGSGTWSRTPEQLYFFKEEKIKRYSDLQKKIVCNVVPFLKKGGHFLYITCSVFKKENEENVKFIIEKFDFTLINMQLIKGYESSADTMFAALFQF